MMAFGASVVNSANDITSTAMGVAINKYFVGVTEKDLSGYYKLTLWSMGFSFWNLALCWLIPVKSEIQAAIEETRLKNGIVRLDDSLSLE